MLCGCGCALIYVNLEAHHHLFHNGVGVVKSQFINSPSCFSEFNVSFAEVMFEVVPCFISFVFALPHSDVIFEDSLICFGCSCIFNQVVYGVEDDVNGLGRIVDHCFYGGGLVVKLLGGNSSIVVVKKLKDGWDEWCNFSGDGVAKGGEIFGVDGFDNMLDEGSFEK